MASRRKSTTPCMVPARDGPEPEDGAGAAAAEEEPEEAAAAAAAGDPGAAEGGYECKYCSFQTSELNLFTMHVDAEHPDVVLNASYVCVECDYHTKSYDALLAHNARLHPGEDGFTRTLLRRNGEAVLQQTVSDLTFDGGFVKTEAEEAAAAEEEDDDSAQTAIALSKTPIMRIRGRPEPKRFCSLKAGGADDVIKLESDEDEENEENREPPAAAAAAPGLLPLSAPLHLQAVPQNLLLGGSSVLQVKGGGGGGVLPPGTLAQVLTALQNQQNQQNQSSQTQLLIPVSSIPSYNSAMDNNLLLLSAYSRFPYPSLSEILGLSSQTKFSEEQIKVWFSAQRLKHGVSWTPEEVEEARRKKFNGTVQTVPPTITVIPANMAAAAANGLQSIFQTCQIVGQPGLVLTQVAGGGAAVPVAPPITLTVAGVSGARPKAAEPSVSESRAEPCTAAAPPDAAAGGKPKKSKEQLAELKASYGRRQFASEAEISRLMQVTKLSKRAIKKWFSDTRYNQRNSRDHGLLGEAPGRAASGRTPRSAGAGPNDGAAAAIVIDSSDDAGESSSPTSGGVPGSSVSAPERRVKLRHAFPDFTPQRFKEKTAEQLLLLEASFLQADTPSDEELSRLRAQTKLTRREVDAWFTERRKAPAASGEADGDGPPAERRSGGGGGRRAVKRTPEQLNILRTAFIRTQWPTAAEYDAMAEQSGLPRHDIVSWFGDTRYAWKNNSLKWYYLYQIGKVDEALNGGSRTQKKSRKRFRGWSRRSRRPYPCKRSPAGGAATIKVKPGKSFLKDYYLKHGFLSESDLDELVTKSSMSYQQVRDWFSETARRAQDGRKLFSEDEEDGDKEDVMDQEEAEGQRADGDGVMEVKEQGDEEEEVREDEEVQEEVREDEEVQEEVREDEEVQEEVQEDEEVQEHSEGVGQSQSEEQT